MCRYHPKALGQIFVLLYLVGYIQYVFWLYQLIRDRVNNFLLRMRIADTDAGLLTNIGGGTTAV